jgi:Outer membrane protein beta-barrel domain
MKTLPNFLLLLFCCLAWNAQAQISIGLQGGLSKAWMEYGDVGLPEDAEIEIRGFNLSGLVYYQFNPYLRLGLEPGYTQRGAACVPGWDDGPLPIFRGDSKLFLRYLEMPLMVEGAFPFWKNRMAVFGKVGYGGALLASGYEEVIDFSGDQPKTDRRKLDLSEERRLNRIDHGFYGSAGLRYQCKRQQLFIALDHYRGLKDADKDNKSLNRDLGISLGWMMGL